MINNSEHSDNEHNKNEKNEHKGEESLETVKVPSKFAKSSFKQEKLKPIAKPIYSDLFVSLTLVAAGAICLAGFVFLLVKESDPDRHIDYTHCKNGLGEKCSDIIKDKSYLMNGDLMPVCECEVHFEIKKDIPAPTGLYVVITNFLQNHRLYAESKDEDQLRGLIYNHKLNKPVSPNKHCREFDDSTQLVKDAKYVFPCGAIASSWFSDRFLLTKYDGTQNIEIVLNAKGVARKSDLKYSFLNPKGFTKDYSNRPPWFDKHFKKPAIWRQQTFVDWWNDGGLENEAFMNWMHISPTSYVRKLLRIVETSNTKCKNFKGLCEGKYTLTIKYNFEVSSFGGRKTIYFSTIKPHGSKNTFLMIIFAILSGLAITLIPIMFFSLPTRREIMNSGSEHMFSRPEVDAGPALFHEVLGVKIPHSSKQGSKADIKV